MIFLLTNSWHTSGILRASTCEELFNCNILIINSINKTKKVIVIEEHMENGGLGDDIMRLAIKLENVKYASIAIPNMFFSNYGSHTELLNTIGLTTEGLINKVKETFNI